MYAGTQVETNRPSSDRLKLPPVVTYVTRLPVPSSPSGTSVSFLNQSSTTTHDRRTPSICTSVARSPSPMPVDRGLDEPEPSSTDKVEPDGDSPPPVSGEVDGSPKPQQQRRPSGIRSTLSCSQLLDRHRSTLVTVKSNPSLMPRNGGGDDRQRDGPATVSSALTRRIRSSRTSVRSAGELESIKNFYSVSAPTSLSSVNQLDEWPNWNDWIAH